MTRHLLVGVFHDTANRALMDSYCKEQFRRMVLPLLTNRSIIFAEGWFSSGLVQPHSQLYSRILNQFVDVLEDVRPSFRVCDPRWERDPEKVEHGREKTQAWMRLQKVFHFPNKPRTWEEVHRLIASNNFDCELTRPLTPDELQLARWIQARTLKFNRNYADGMRRCKADVCVFVGGLAHAVCLHHITGYELINCYETSSAFNFFIPYVHAHVCPQKVLQQ